MKKVILLLTLTITFLFFTHCVSISKEAPQKKYYSLEADKSKIKKNLPFKFSKLRVNKFRISSNYESKEFIYRKDLEFASDFYNQFLVSPSTNITEQVVGWFNESKLAEIVTNRVGGGDSQIVLEGNINLLYADFSGGKVHSILEIEFYLSDIAKDQILFKKVYSKKVLSSDKEPVSILKAWNQSLTDILINLEEDLRKLPLN